MSNEQPGEKFTRVVTHEAWLFGQRLTNIVFSGMAMVLSYFATTTLGEIKSSIAKVENQVSSLDRRYNEDRVSTIDRLGKVEGQVGEIKGSIDVHRGRLNDIDIDRRAMWQRMFEMGRSRLNPNPKPDPP